MGKLQRQGIHCCEAENGTPQGGRISQCQIKGRLQAANAAGELELSRWESYRKLKEESIDKAEMLRRKQEWSKGVAKFSKQRKKEIW